MEGSMAENNGYFFSVPGFDSQNAHGCSEWSITPAPWYCRSLLASAGTRDPQGSCIGIKSKIPKHMN